MTWLAIVGSSVLAIALLRGMVLICDELQHDLQIHLFLARKLELNPRLTTIPGYHAAIAGLARITGIRPGRQSATDHERALAALLALPAVVIFFLIARRLDPERAHLRTLQLHFLPILFPFFFMLYTDAFALMLILLCFYLLARGWRSMAALSGVLAILVRQNNVIWFVAAWLTVYYLDFGFRLSLPNLTAFLRRTPLFLLGLAGFCAFILLNGGVALGEKQMHPGDKLSLGNIYFFLALFFLLLLPANLLRLRPALGWLWKDKRRLLLLPALYAIFMLTFVNDHPYNNQPEVTFFLRNKLLNAAVSSGGAMTLFFIPVALGLLSLAATPLLRKEYYLLYPATAALLVPAWLIEQRYYIVTFALFLLVRVHEARRIEYTTLAYHAVITTLFMVGIREQNFFL